jgi:hypothetical protein
MKHLRSRSQRPSPRLNRASQITFRPGWLTHRTLDLILLAGAAIALVGLSQPIAQAMIQP